MLEKLTPSLFNPVFSVLKRKQILLLWGLVGFLALVIGGLINVVTSQASSVKSTSSYPSSYKSSLTTGSRRVDTKEVWMEKTSADQNLNTKRLEGLEKMLQTLLKLNGSRADVPNNPVSSPAVSSTATPSSPSPSGSDVGQTEGLRQELKETFIQDLAVPGSPSPSPSVLPLPPTSSEKGLSLQTPVQMPASASPKKAFRSKGIQKVSLQLQNPRGYKALKTTDNTIPAGAFAQAVLVGGVDASTSIQAPSDPRPVLLRITNKGTLPRQFRSDLCGCHALAACYGDISSERVYMDLEKVTCTERKTGELIEIAVQGYIAGEDGRAGLRGRVVDRAGESMRNAAIGGFLSGMGNFLSQSNNPITFSPMSGLAQTNPLTNGDLLKHGAAKGMTGALERYADFYIKRAEQMQPVIQVQAGRLVDIVFTQGTVFGDSAVRGALSRSNDQQRYQKIQDTQAEAAPKPVEAWIPPSKGETP